MSNNGNEARIVAFLLGEDLGDVSEMRGAMHEARAHLLRAVEILGDEERDGPSIASRRNAQETIA